MSTRLRFVIPALVPLEAKGLKLTGPRFLFSNPFLFSPLHRWLWAEEQVLLRFNDCFLTPVGPTFGITFNCPSQDRFLYPLVVACTEHRPPGKSISTQIFVYRFSSAFIFVDHNHSASSWLGNYRYEACFKQLLESNVENSPFPYTLLVEVVDFKAIEMYIVRCYCNIVVIHPYRTSWKSWSNYGMAYQITFLMKKRNKKKEKNS